MLIDWLTREGGIVLSWWALVTLAGVAALPLCLRLLGGLPDRGYTLARAVGLLLVSFVFWLLASLGFLRNTADSMILSWVIVMIAALALYFGAGERIDFRAWWRENNRVVLVGELLFFALLFSWAIYRAHQNSLSGTEKPMELAFLSATMRSDIFPPADPWLSGYAISYYYFGYVIAAILSVLSGVGSTVGFNMTNALLFALTGLTVFGVVYNMVRSRAEAVVRARRRIALLVGILAAVFVILMSNFEMIFVEIPYQTRAVSSDYLRFWNLNERQVPRPAPAVGEDPDRWGFWWWWHGARVISDRNLDGGHNEVIDEFPHFSFLLSDNHPHVLALPFAVMTLGLALNTLLRKRKPNRFEIAFYAICIGGLIFLNTWDGPIYLILLVAAEGLRRVIASSDGRLRWGDVRNVVWLAVQLLVLAAVFYLPFLVAFRSQAAGISPNLLNPTLPAQFFLVYGPFILLLTPFLIVEARRAGHSMNWGVGVKVGALILGGLIALMLLLSLLGYFIPEVRDQVDYFVAGNGGWVTTIMATFAKRVAYFPTALLLTIGIIIVAGRLFPRRQPADPLDETSKQAAVTYSPETGFALLLVAAALVLALVPEFIYLRDNFGSRMNTIFKFYYQAWVMLSIAGAYGVYSVLSGAHPLAIGWRVAYGGLVAVVTIAGLLYPIFGIQTRMFIDGGRRVGDNSALTLDGGGTISGIDDYVAALCLANLVTGTDAVVASAIGGSYNWISGAVSTYTGIPTIFNWPGHQGQWRGSTYVDAVGTRQQDIDGLYANPSWVNARDVLTRYGIDYVVFGAKERSQYDSTTEEKFLDNLQIACEAGSTRIYRVPEWMLVQAQ